MLQRKVCSITLILVWLPLASVMLAVQVSAQEAQTIVGAEIKGLAPVSQEILQVELPKAAEIQLDNGLRLMVLEDHRVPLVSFQIILFFPFSILITSFTVDCVSSTQCEALRRKIVLLCHNG